MIGYRKYRGLSIIGYLLIIACAAFLAYLAIVLAGDVAASGENTSLSIGMGYVVFLVIWIICAAIQIIPIAFGITGWVLTKRNNGFARPIFIVQTFLPLVMLGLTLLGGYLAYTLPV